MTDVAFGHIRRLIYMSYKKYKGYEYQTVDYTVNDMDVSLNSIFSVVTAIIAFAMLIIYIIILCAGGEASAAFKVSTVVMMSIFSMLIIGRLIMMTVFINGHTVTGYRIIKNSGGKFVIQGRNGLGRWKSISSSGYSFRWNSDACGYSNYDDAVEYVKKISSAYPIQPRLLKAFIDKGVNGLLRRVKIDKGTTVIEFTNENDLR